MDTVSAPDTLCIEPFFRVDKSRSRQLGGVGLGLSLSHTIVELHHGQIRAESAQPQGSCFVVELPELRPSPSKGIISNHCHCICMFSLGQTSLFLHILTNFADNTPVKAI